MCIRIVYIQYGLQIHIWHGMAWHGIAVGLSIYRAHMNRHTYTLTQNLYLDFRYTIHFSLLFCWGGTRCCYLEYTLCMAFEFNTIQNGSKWMYKKRPKSILIHIHTHTHELLNIIRTDERTWNIWPNAHTDYSRDSIVGWDFDNCF